jgi:ABC-type lipoprotein export system ATPase subunit
MSYCETSQSLKRSQYLERSQYHAVDDAIIHIERVTFATQPTSRSDEGQARSTVDGYSKTTRKRLVAQSGICTVHRSAAVLFQDTSANLRCAPSMARNGGALNPTSVSAPILRAESLTLHFDEGKTKALDGIDIAIAEGECLALVGPSGCGKSSLLNLIGTLDCPTSGQIYFRSSPYSAVGDRSLFRRQHIGFVFQSFHLITTLSALDNVIVPTIGVPGSASNHKERATRLLSRLGLRDRLDHFPNKMSGGERQRVAIARALINDPEVLLADEPTGSLDSANAMDVLVLIDEIRKERGLTVILVTHDTDISSRADRVVHMRDGKLDERPDDHR